MTNPSPVREADGRADVALVEEGRLLGKYLLGATPEDDTLARYADACTLALTGPATPEDLSMLRFVARRPWSLPFLDAASALLRPQALLRKKLLLMLSILETLPSHVDTFTAPPSSKWRLLARLVGLGTLSVLLVLGGLFVYRWSLRTR